MDYHLVVVSPHAGRAVGDVIVDPGAVAATLASEHAAFVRRIAAPPMPAPPLTTDTAAPAAPQE